MAVLQTVRPARAASTRPRTAAAAVAFSLLASPFISLAAAATTTPPSVYPYVPTTILVPTTSNSSSTSSQNGTVAYIFSPNANNRVDLLSLDLSSTLSSTADASNVKTLSVGVPFLSNGVQGTTASYLPVVLANGTLVVYTGDCSTSSTGSPSLWTFNGSDSTWTSHNTTAISESGVAGPWFLGGGYAFSTQLAPTVSDPTIYVYGGMCPSLSTSSTSSSTLSSTSSSATSSSSSSWQSSATYTNAMVKLAPGTDDDGSYTPSFVTSKGPPVAEAGFSFTPLSASISNRSGVVTQQVNSILLGGHTQKAFINMSTAAVWSLPEEAWSFVPISAPSSTGTTELVRERNEARAETSKRDTVAAPDSRSGHTAVLSEDGASLVVLGGWVGDVSQAASPQLAVLEMGADYGEWQWSIPSDQPSSAGMYGHGAALLPGNVMMVYGGYNITTTTSSAKMVRRDTGADSLMFYNMTSMAWMSGYTNPTSTSGTSGSSGSSASSGSSSSRSRRLGLGIGLGLGIPLLLLLLALLFCCCRRRTRERRQRHDALQALAQDHNDFVEGHDEMAEHGNEHSRFTFNWGPRAAREFYAGGHDPYNQADAASASGSHTGTGDNMFESLRGSRSGRPTSSHGIEGGDDAGLFGIHGPSSSGITRKPTRQQARGLYQPTTISDYESSMAVSDAAGTAAASGVAAAAVGGGAAAAMSGIHPIYEADEEEEDDEAASSGVGVHGQHARLTTVGGHLAPGTASTASSGRSISPETDDAHGDPFATPTIGTARAVVMASPSSGATVNLNPFVRNTPSPEAGLTRAASSATDNNDGKTGKTALAAGAVGVAGAAAAALAVGAHHQHQTSQQQAGQQALNKPSHQRTGSDSTTGQDRDVQEWVAGLEIEDLLFSPPAPGANTTAAASAAQGQGIQGPNLSHNVAVGGQAAHRGRLSPNSMDRRQSRRSKAPSSSSGSPTRGGYLGAAAAVGAGGAYTFAGGDDEARTASNLSDRSAFSFLTRSGSSRSRLAVGLGMGGAHAGGNNANNGGNNGNGSSGSSDSTYNSAVTGFHALRVEGPGLLYGKSHSRDNSGSGISTTGGGGGVASVAGSIHNTAGVVPPGTAITTSGAASGPSYGALGRSSSEYTGAAGVMASGMAVGGAAAVGAYGYSQHQRHIHQVSRDTNSPVSPISAGAGSLLHHQHNTYEEDESAALTGPTLPGTPSKNKVRRSWMGNIIRIFSAGGNSSSTTSLNTSLDDSGHDDGGTVGFFQPSTGLQQGPSGLNYHATLLRRKQGRFDWEGDESRDEENTALGAIRSGRAGSVSAGGHSSSVREGGGIQSRTSSLVGGGPSGPSGVMGGRSSSMTSAVAVGGAVGALATTGVAATGAVGAGRRDGSGKSDSDWDVEKALQGRLVQVMFTVPRDQQLRVVNAEVEREEEEAEIVNPDEDEKAALAAASAAAVGAPMKNEEILDEKAAVRGLDLAAAEESPVAGHHLRRVAASEHMISEEDEEKRVLSATPPPILPQRPPQSHLSTSTIKYQPVPSTLALSHSPRSLGSPRSPRSPEVAALEASSGSTETTPTPATMGVFGTTAAAAGVAGVAGAGLATQSGRQRLDSTLLKLQTALAGSSKGKETTAGVSSGSRGAYAGVGQEDDYDMLDDVDEDARPPPVTPTRSPRRLVKTGSIDALSVVSSPGGAAGTGTSAVGLGGAAAALSRMSMHSLSAQALSGHSRTVESFDTAMTHVYTNTSTAEGDVFSDAHTLPEDSDEYDDADDGGLMLDATGRPITPVAPLNITKAVGDSGGGPSRTLKTEVSTSGLSTISMVTAPESQSQAQEAARRLMRGKYGGYALTDISDTSRPSTPASAVTAEDLHKPSGFVLDMIEQIETNSPRSGSPVRME